MRSEHKVVTITAVGGNRCPVFLLDTYISKLPTQAKKMDLFYCHPRPPVPNSALEPWYYNILIGKTTLFSMVKIMFDEASISGKTNHSLRVAGASSLFVAGVPERIIQERIGHVSVEALRKYERVTNSQELAVSKILAGEEDSFKPSEDTSKPDKKPLAFSQPPALAAPQYNHCTFNVSYSTPPPPPFYSATPGFSHFQPPLQVPPTIPTDLPSDKPLE